MVNNREERTQRRDDRKISYERKKHIISREGKEERTVKAMPVTIIEYISTTTSIFHKTPLELS
jgi:hypothetical protein